MSEKTSPTNIQPHSLTALPLQLFANETFLSNATGSLFVFEDSLFLVSNWHVFSGKNSQSGQDLTGRKVNPSRVEFMLHRGDIGTYSKRNSARLLDQDGNFLWVQHEKGQLYDIAAVRLGKLDDLTQQDQRLRWYPPNLIDESPMRLHAGLDITILGFPEKLTFQEIFPVWKRGSIAAEPHIDRIDELPVYLVDALTRQGMSGSPVFAYSESGYLAENGQRVVGVRGSKFIGIYSGRYGASNQKHPAYQDLALGRVWKPEVVQEMLAKPAKAQIEFTK